MTPRNKRTGARCQTVKLGLLQRHRQRGKSTGLTKGHTWSECPTRVSRPPIVLCLRPRGPREKGDLRWALRFPWGRTGPDVLSVPDRRHWGVLIPPKEVGVLLREWG